MAAYTPAIDAQIGEILHSRGKVEPWDLAGVADEDGSLFLRQYARAHASDGGLTFEGSTLLFKPAVVSETVPPSAEKPSPVDQVLMAPVGNSRLDTKPAGSRVPKWWWLLPFTFLALGGLIAWWFVRDENRAVARAMLITGIVLTLITVATIGPTTSLLDEMSGALKGL